MIVYLFLFLAASVQGDGKPFDTEIFPPGSVNFDCWASSLWEWSELDDGLHTLLSPEELHFVFGTKDHSMVSKEEYSVVAIKDTLQQAKQVAKRAGVMIMCDIEIDHEPVIEGIPAPDKAFSIDIEGKTYNLK